MEITLDKKLNNEGLIRIKLAENDYQLLVDKKLRDYANKVNIKGFRQGRVPVGIVKKMFGKSILAEEISHLSSSKLYDYLKENNIHILGEPLPNIEKIKDINWETQRDFEFEYQLGIIESFPYELSDKVRLKLYEIEVDEKTVEETIADLRHRFGKMEYPETSAIGDFLYGELRDENDNVIKEHTFVDSNVITSKEQKKFEGKKENDEVRFNIASIYEDKKHISTLLGVTEHEAEKTQGEYVLKIKMIRRTEPAIFNKELFDRVFGKDIVDTEVEFVAKVKETVAENYKREATRFLEHHIEDYYIENTKLNLPDTFLKNWLKTSSNGKITDEILFKEYDSYKRNITWEVVQNRIVEDHKIVVETEEVIEKARRLVLSQFGELAFVGESANQLNVIVHNFLQNENGKNYKNIYNQLKNEKTLNYIRERITITEEKVTSEKFRELLKEHDHH